MTAADAAFGNSMRRRRRRGRRRGVRRFQLLFVDLAHGVSRNLRRKRDDGYCSLLCLEIDRRLTKTRALIGEKGISPTAAALWAAAVSLSDQLTEVDRLEKMLKSS